ncbi:MAG: hypothetical protein GDA49_09015 [Rhodospirillales bacterium]|nr:hypothetical protein [Rhodospirillales bacterium]
MSVSRRRLIAGPFEAFDAVLNGRVELFHGSPCFWVDRHAAFNFFFSAIPFGLTTTESAAWLSHGGGMALWRELYDGFGLVPFFSGTSGQQAADWVGPWNDIAMGLYQWAPIYYMPGWHEPSAMIEVAIGCAAWDAIDDDFKAMVETAAAAATEQALSDFAYHNAEAYPQLAELGVDVRAFPDAVVDRLCSETAEVVAELGTEDDIGQRIDASYRDFLAKARAYAPHALQGFLNLRDG